MSESSPSEPLPPQHSSPLVVVKQESQLSGTLEVADVMDGMHDSVGGSRAAPSASGHIPTSAFQGSMTSELRAPQNQLDVENGVKDGVEKSSTEQEYGGENDLSRSSPESGDPPLTNEQASPPLDQDAEMSTAAQQNVNSEVECQPETFVRLKPDETKSMDPSTFQEEKEKKFSDSAVPGNTKGKFSHLTVYIAESNIINYYVCIILVLIIDIILHFISNQKKFYVNTVETNMSTNKLSELAYIQV